MESVCVDLLAAGEEAAWDRFVLSSPRATFFHLSGWKRVVEKAFRHRTFFLVARRGGELCGILPLTQVKSVLFGNSLISNAFCVYGGIVADDTEVENVLKTESLRLARELRVDGVEFRCTPLSPANSENEKSIYVTFRRTIASDLDANLKSIPRKQRAMVRKGIAGGLRSEIDDGVDRLHHVYAQSVHNLGTPVFAKRYFQILKEEFGTACDIVTIVEQKRAIASVMNFYFRDEVLPYYGGGLFEARAVAGNDFMYWEVMRRACQRHFRVFDFGRSKIGTGAYAFKHNWGFQPTPLLYEYCPVASNKKRDINPLNPKYSAAIQLWRHLPLAVTKLLGPAIVRSIG